MSILGLDALKERFDLIVAALPSSYRETLLLLQDKFTDQQISMIMDSPDYYAANKLILNYLLERVRCKDDVIELCEFLSSASLLLPDSSHLVEIVAEIKTGEKFILYNKPKSFIILNKYSSSCSAGVIYYFTICISENMKPFTLTNLIPDITAT